ncbi:MAG: DUF2520 domain-containing protein, partial [Hymenobacter sp.]
MHIGLFGAGRVAVALAPALAAASHQLVFIASRTPASAATLAAQLPSPCPALGLAQLAPLPPADLYLLAVPDAVVPEVLAAITWPAGALVAHVAGALPLAVFAAAPQVRGGVLYPLQTFSPDRAIAWPTVPLFVEATDPAAEATLLALARSLSQRV